MKGTMLLLCICGLACTGTLFAQTAANSLSSAVTRAYHTNRMNLMETAEKVPEEDYNFKPTPDIRTLAEVLNHVASSQMHACSSVLGSSMNYTSPGANASKANVLAALKASFEECDHAYDSTNDQNGMEPVHTYMGEVPRLAALMMNNQHDSEQYGILSVYMRLKGIVPPSTARAGNAREEHRR